MAKKNRAGRQRRQRQARERRGRRGGPMGGGAFREEHTNHTDHTGPEGRFGIRDDAGIAWERAVHLMELGQSGPADELLVALASRATSSTVESIASQSLLNLVGVLWENGWQPRDVARLVGRKHKAGHEALAAAMILTQSNRYRDSFADETWNAHLDDIASRSGCAAGGPESGLLSRFRRSFDLDLLAVLRMATTLSAFLRTLPRVPTIGPRPGHDVGSADPLSGLPLKLLERVQGLLRKAESSEFPEEAEALTAKAQELMGRYAIDDVLAAARTTDGSGHREAPISRRIAVDDPHAHARGLLLQQIAQANRCRVVWSKELGFSTATGFAADLDIVELLYASLSVQATRAMTAHGSIVDIRGTHRTASFRRSFLVSYAVRIGERLQSCVRATVAEASTHSADLLPILASRQEDVDHLFDRTVGTVRQVSVGASHGGGWAAGRRAADAADLALFEKLEAPV